MEKEITILTKSIKRGEYCIAGIDTTTGEWIRPISDNIANEGSVPLRDITYGDRSQVQVLDKVKIKFISYNPTKSQPENYKYDSSVSWQKTGKITLNDIISNRGYDNPDKIFYNRRKEVSEEEIGGQASLLLVNVKNSSIFIKTFSDGKKRIQFNFEYNGISYRYFKVSDEAITKALANQADGSCYYRDNLAVVLSLTDKYQLTGKYYKMVAQMFY